MPFTARVFRILEAELNAKLSFPFSIVENVTRPGARTIRPGESFRFRVCVRNDSAIAMKNLRGAIHPTRFARFAVTPFQVDTLGPHVEVEITTLEALILQMPAGGPSFDQLATVNFVSQADLSKFSFEDRDRPLLYARPAATPAVRTA
jgi:hypothetical protein